jgi:hypothetical protein
VQSIESNQSNPIRDSNSKILLTQLFISSHLLSQPKTFWKSGHDQYREWVAHGKVIDGIFTSYSN